MKEIVIKFVLFIYCLLSGCFGFWDSGSDRITGRYIVLWIDLIENRGISKETDINSSSSIQIVPEYVFAVGHNDEYIIAKQHPGGSKFGGRGIDKGITNYYIVKTSKEFSNDVDKINGPLNKKQFDSLRNYLKIETIQFDQLYPEDP